MRFYEFEAKQLLAKHRIPLVRSEVANTAAEAEKIASDIGEPVVLKAQAIAPGLAAASVREARDPAAAKAAAAELLQGYLVDCYIDDPVGVWEWVQGNLLPILPISIRYGPAGLYPVVWRSVIEDETDEALFEALWFQQGRELESLALDDSSAVAAALDALAGGALARRAPRRRPVRVPQRPHQGPRDGHEHAAEQRLPRVRRTADAVRSRAPPPARRGREPAPVWAP